MTTNSLIEEARQLLAKVPERPWYADFDDAHDVLDHKDSGLAMVDTGRSQDWPIARLCEWHAARFIARAPELIESLCTELERLQREQKVMKEAVGSALQLLEPINEDIQQPPQPRDEYLAISETWNDGSNYNHALLNANSLIALIAKLQAAITPKETK